jgi:hypothetical protein
MAVGFIFEGNISPEQYERMRDQVMGGNQLQPGQLYHVAGPSESGFCVVEIWESPEAAARFYQQLAPALQQANIAVQQRSFEVINTLQR